MIREAGGSSEQHFSAFALLNRMRELSIILNRTDFSQVLNHRRRGVPARLVFRALSCSCTAMLTKGNVSFPSKMAHRISNSEKRSHRLASGEVPEGKGGERRFPTAELPKGHGGRSARGNGRMGDYKSPLRVWKSGIDSVRLSLFSRLYATNDRHRANLGPIQPGVLPGSPLLWSPHPFGQ